jgi:DNA-binding transcriptional LysR family regulator
MVYDRTNSLKLSQLQILIAVTDYGSFSEAALQLQMSQSAVSYAIATLENDLGVLVFSRGRYGANLTPVGQQIVERARQILNLMEEIGRQADLAKGLKGGQVRISSFRSAATHILPEVIAEFYRRFPAIAISLAEYDDGVNVENDLREGRADLGLICYHHLTSQEFEISELMRDEFVVLLPATFRLNAQQLTWQELTSYPLIMASDGDACNAMVYAHSAKFDITLQATYHVRSDATIVSMVAKGLGVAVTPRLAAEPIPPGVQVCSLPIPLFRTIGMAILQDALLTPATFAFLDLLKEMMLPIEPK